MVVNIIINILWNSTWYREHIKITSISIVAIGISGFDAEIADSDLESFCTNYGFLNFD